MQDILNILSRRYPVGEAVIFPCVVQGDYAVESICEALVFADGCGCDVIICGRGGRFARRSGGVQQREDSTNGYLPCRHLLSPLSVTRRIPRS